MAGTTLFQKKCLTADIGFQSVKGVTKNVKIGIISILRRHNEMGGSSAKPSDILGKYRPSQAVLNQDKLLKLHLASSDIIEIRRFNSKIAEHRRNFTQLEKDYCMNLLGRLQKELGDFEKSKTNNILKQLKITLTKSGVSLEFTNLLITLEAWFRKLRNDFNRTVDLKQVSWHCKSCGSNQFKLVANLIQCELCNAIEDESSERALVSIEIPKSPKVVNFRLAKTRAEFEECVNDLIESAKFDMISGNNRMALIKTGEKFGVYIPPPYGLHKKLMYNAKMFNLFGFKTPLSLAEELELLKSHELVSQYRKTLKKWHPDTAVDINAIVSNFWITLCLATYRVFRRRRLNFDRGFLKPLEHPLFLTRKVQDMMWIAEMVEAKE